MALIIKVFIRNNRIVQVGDRVKIVGDDWIGAEGQDYKGQTFTIVEDSDQYRFVNPDEKTIRIGGVLHHNEDFE